MSNLQVVLYVYSIMQLLPKGTIKILTSDPSYYYVKLEDEDFAWWMSQCNPNLDDNKKMHVRMTDLMVLKETHFNVFVPVEKYLK